MNQLPELFDNNRRWAAGMVARQPRFFNELSAQQAPRYLWIGCSDSRVPANEIVGLAPGELFVHRNVANLVLHNDFSCLSVLQYAIDVLGVEHLIVCGHYGCGGVQAAWEERKLGLVDNWLQSVRDVAHLYRDQLLALPGDGERRQRLTVHAWVYSLQDGLLRDLGFCVSDPAGAEAEFSRVAGLGTLGASGTAHLHP